MSPDQRHIAIAFLALRRRGEDVTLADVLDECALFEVDPAPVALLVLGLLASSRGWVPASGRWVDLTTAAMREAMSYFCAVTGAHLEPR